RLPRRRLRCGARGDGRRRRHADRPGATAGQPRHDGRVRAPEGQLRHADRARAGVTAGVTRTAVLPAAVLWDMDGTLVDTEPYWIAAERELVESFGNEWPDHHAHALIGSDLTV